MNEVQRSAALEQLEDAKAAYQRVGFDLDEVDKIIVRVERNDGTFAAPSALAFWYARREELLEKGLAASQRVAAIYAALSIQDQAPDSGTVMERMPSRFRVSV